MKKIFLSLALAAMIASNVNAQEYKVSKSTGRLEIREVNHVSIEGHNGSEIIFTSRSNNRERDERAQGLRALSSLGLEDNTGLGLSVIDNGGVVEVRQLKKTDDPDIKILVPKGVVISYTHSSPYGNRIDIKNFEGEIHVSTIHNGVILTNTSGSASVKTVHGDIDASMETALKASVSLESVHGHVDLALPVATKANLTLSTNWAISLISVI